ncbi:MAG: hypothetical protein JNM27_01650 [Leptospirales bacterium]|nr:hypothetical protein [Leptospirales bacterium]
MQHNYIPIESIDEIDVLKISVRDMDKRFIDRQGNRYALRFNLKTRRPEIVQVVSNRLEARRLQQTIIQDKKKTPDRTAATGSVSESVLEEESSQSSTPFIPDDEVFHEQKFVEECLAELPRLKESQQASMTKLRQSRVFENVLTQEFMDLSRDIEREAWRKADESITVCKEWLGRPPSIHAAMIRVAPEKRKVLDSIADEPMKLESMRRWEWQDRLADSFARLLKYAEDLRHMTENVPEEEMLKHPSNQRQFFKDSRASLGVTRDACQEKLARIENWRKRYL